MRYIYISCFFLGSILFSLEFKLPNNSWKERSMKAHRENVHRISKKSLLHCCKWEYSQFGEDGIIEEIFNRIGITKGYFIEFGGMDGVSISNTYNLFKKGWEGFYIEGNPKYKQALKENFLEGCGVVFSIEYIRWKEDQEGRFFDDIADEYVGNREIDFLSIDIDGGDYYIFKDLKRRPKVICVECGIGYHPLFEKEVEEQKALGNVNQPMSLFIKQGYEMGYTPVAFNIINLFLVRNDYAHLFEDVVKDPVVLFRDSFRVHDNKRRLLSLRKHTYSHLEDKRYDKILRIRGGM